MTFKILIYIILATLSSLFVSGFKEASETFIVVIGIILLLTFHTQSYKIYNSKLKMSSRNKITKGLFLSIILSLFMVLIIAYFPINYQSIRTNGSTDNLDVSSLLMPLAYILSAIVCFIIDSFYNKSLKVSKKQILKSSLTFYAINYAIGFIIALILGGAQALSFG